MTQREELIKELRSTISNGGLYGLTIWQSKVVADFILADRKRIVEPLVKWKESHTGKIIESWPEHPVTSIRETLKLAGEL